MGHMVGNSVGHSVGHSAVAAKPASNTGRRYVGEQVPLADAAELVSGGRGESDRFDGGRLDDALDDARGL